jgi:putative serine protease PepD
VSTEHEGDVPGTPEAEPLRPSEPADAPSAPAPASASPSDSPAAPGASGASGASGVSSGHAPDSEAAPRPAGYAADPETAPRPAASPADARTARQPAVSPADAETAPQPAAPAGDYSHLPPPTPPVPAQPAATAPPADPYVTPPAPAAAPALPPTSPIPAATGYAYGTTPPPPAQPPTYPAPYGAAPFGGMPVEPKPRGRGGLVALLAAVAVVAGALGGGIGAYAEKQNSSAIGSTTISAGSSTQLARPATSVAGIAARALPSVVTIHASGSTESGTGSGFVFDTQGHILTNNHVVAPSLNGGKLTVTLQDGSTYNAEVVGRASGYDVAVVKLDNVPAGKLNPLVLGNSDDVAVGDETVAIGAPFGLSGTVTSGIVSAKNRPVASGDSGSTQTSYMNALQTDASINPGNSGGPLLNASGQVIGINSAIQSTSSGDSNPFGSSSQSGSIGLGFAIPINEAKRVAQQLISTGKPVYPIIGVLRDDNYSGTGAEIATSPVNGTPPVTPGGPADKAGLQAGDVITKLNGVLIDSGPTLVSEIWSLSPGQTISVTYTRNGQTHTTQLTLGSRVGDQ